MLVFLALLVPVLYSIVNLFDKVLVSGDEDDAEPGALLALSGLFAGIFAIGFGLYIFFTGISFGSLSSGIMLISIGALYYAAIRVYMNIMKDDESSRVTAWFQVVPLFGMVGAFFLLKEVPQWYQIGAIVLLVIGGFMLSYKEGEFNKELIFWMILVAGFIALYDVLFANYGRDINEFSAIFFMLLGKTICGFFFLIFDKRSWNGFWIGLNTKFKIQFLSESTNTIADILQCYCLLFLPVLFVQGVCSIQPLCVLIGAILLGNFIPEIKEGDEGDNIKWKVLGIVLMISGGIFLS